jgi:hypothetical protein
LGGAWLTAIPGWTGGAAEDKSDREPDGAAAGRLEMDRRKRRINYQFRDLFIDLQQDQTK